MNSLFGAYTAFTAFGAAIIAILSAGGAVQTIADYWTRRTQERHTLNPFRSWLAWFLSLATVGLTTVLITLVALGAGCGLFLTFLWLQGGPSGGTWNWTYSISVDLFKGEVIGLTIVTALALFGAAAVIVNRHPPNGAPADTPSTPSANDIIAQLAETTKELSSATAAYTRTLTETPDAEKEK